MINGKKMLVVSAHAADYVWRAGGTIAKYIKHGAEVHLVVLSFGGRGESNDLWKQPGATAESVKAVRRAETEAAADILGIKNIEFWDLQDYPIVTDDALTDRLVGKILDAPQGVGIAEFRLEDNGGAESFHQPALPGDAEFGGKVAVHPGNDLNIDRIHYALTFLKQKVTAKIAASPRLMAAPAEQPE